MYRSCTMSHRIVCKVASKTRIKQIEKPKALEVGLKVNKIDATNSQLIVTGQRLISSLQGNNERYFKSHPLKESRGKLDTTKQEQENTDK